MRAYGAGSLRFAGPPGWGALRVVTRAGLLLTAAGYLAGLVRPSVEGLLAALPPAVFPGLQLWRLLTFPFVVQGIWNLLFALLLFWSLGVELEVEWGSRRYALFLLLATFSAGLLGTAAALLLGAGLAAGVGPGGLLTALIVAWALRGPLLRVNFFGVLPMTRRTFALLAVLLLVFGELDAARLAPWPVSLAQLAFALGGLPVSFLFAGAGRGSGGLSRFSPKRLLRRRRFQVVEGSRDWRVH